MSMKSVFKEKIEAIIKKHGLKDLKEVVAKQKELGQKGFTLLELLVVVAILAAIAGTATIALKDTDARASAAAHVAMMDELNKGIRTYRVLKRNELPNNFDSLVMTGTSPAPGTAVTGTLVSTAAIADVARFALTSDMVDRMAAGGLSALQYVDTTLDPDGAGACSDIPALVKSRDNMVVAGNIFLTPAANGCGVARTLEAGDEVMVWTGGTERILGQPSAADVATPATAGDSVTAVNGAPLYLITGVGPASTLFNANELGGMTTVPVYRHVKPHEYNRFMAIWTLGGYDSAGAVYATDQLELLAIVDGAGDTKEEELGEWDGTRNTI